MRFESTGDQIFPDDFFGWLRVLVVEVDTERVVFKVVGGRYDGEMCVSGRAPGVEIEPLTHWHLRVDGDSYTLVSPEVV